MSLWATASDDIGGGTAAGILVVYFIILILVVAGMWKVFTKAGEEGWKAIIPIYNIWTLLKIVGRPGWWIILFIIPFRIILKGFVNFQIFCDFILKIIEVIKKVHNSLLSESQKEAPPAKTTALLFLIHFLIDRSQDLTADPLQFI